MSEPEHIDTSREVAALSYRTAASLLRLCTDPDQIPHPDETTRIKVSAVLRMWASGMDEKALNHEVNMVLGGMGL